MVGGLVYPASGTAYFNRPGPRIVGGLERLAEVVHPETFHEIPGRILVLYSRRSLRNGPSWV